MILTVTSSARAVDLPSEDWALCCGLAPEVFTWTRGMGKGMIGINCRNLACKNHKGVLAYEGDARETWERWRNRQEDC